VSKHQAQPLLEERRKEEAPLFSCHEGTVCLTTRDGVSRVEPASSTEAKVFKLCPPQLRVTAHPSLRKDDARTEGRYPRKDENGAREERKEERKKEREKEREKREVKDEKKRRAGACRGARVPAQSQSPTQTEEKRACARTQTPPSRQGRRCPGFPVSLVMCICVDGLDREHGKLCSWAPSCALTSPGNASRTFTNVSCHVPT
jgi:hypothetical protein